MFVWKLDSFLSELELAHPGTQPIVLQMAQAIRNGDLQNAAENFRQLPNQSIDYALMEKSRQVAMIPSTFQWDDLGSFDALLRSFPTDENGNVVFGNVQAIDCENSVLYNECTECVMAAVNIKNMVMVQTADAVLLCPLQDSQRVKEIVAKLSGSPFV
jgi:mannose-1-phosphate guanylyltransferase